ncbi:undecaprenyl-diphosphatase [bacterium (Candidatus Blackallbacteria) CG17_big_fil_post_rev_8_21_14_2_50_48_46]|uniref:Undecaprenyl-diphosphatase n=1 Tax=bacterium (Candidatus Blackallbacteria) CG17_big_fil_post_rev_8_21_14_2_50_48_46 TaxID=2014261 RepID=A0A2M7G2I8_9BACT|nr:MAG: undecaprenyl-diphosphatase [bacterium (Candidatus Blackallbacteria) CG18_big_fil_WC_8_21_14_2_50_49_26]PIW15991.1 MAG: undecaprenyl-diphosphatase [bacterium (Candidatus Blackallbacteria) CG17_big_fil_post_rev_8_21_14_2_50_48_46]PIW50403.1 MAG: undecaprenyl-diphosphatase [bacterium (Candidatus Blackallbacteria) CG13_big_fil_rev_8_21_14_2_50_49_14]
MRFYQAATLGLIQGITEFLPVSSTAHLISLPRLWGWQRPGLSFDTSLHLGTLLATGLYLRQDFKRILESLQKPLPQNEVFDLFLSSLPAGLAGLLLEKRIEKYLRSTQTLSWGILIGALFMAWADAQKQAQPLKQPTRLSRFLTGSSQALALFPGISRSGVTLATGLACGLERALAARESFLIGFPIITAAGLFKLKDFVKNPPNAKELGLLATALASASLSGYFCLKLLLRFLEQNSLKPFVLYRLGLTLFLLSQKSSEI